MLPFIEVGGERDLLEKEEEPLIATMATPSLSESELSSSESHSLSM
jgi:ribulose 1,5-bisphosphate carboxylase large subunit-like protein